MHQDTVDIVEHAITKTAGPAPFSSQSAYGSVCVHPRSNARPPCCPMTCEAQAIPPNSVCVCLCMHRPCEEKWWARYRSHEWCVHTSGAWRTTWWEELAAVDRNRGAAPQFSSLPISPPPHPLSSLPSPTLFTTPPTPTYPAAPHSPCFSHPAAS